MIRMKLIFPLIVVLITMTCGCGSSGNPDPNSRKPNESNLSGPPPDACNPPKNQVLPLDTAELLITNFLKNSKGNDIASNYGMGTFLPLEFLLLLKQDEQPLKGKYLYPCLNTVTKEFFISIGENDELCDVLERSQFAISSQKKYRKTIGNQNFPSNQNYTQAWTKNFLSTFRIPQADLMTESEIIPSNQLSSANLAFKTHFNSEVYVDYGSGFVQNNHLNDFKAQKCEGNAISGAAIFLGIDNRNSKEKVRMILIPVKQDGYLFLTNSIILEKSWPPRVP